MQPLDQLLRLTLLVPCDGSRIRASASITRNHVEDNEEKGWGGVEHEDHGSRSIVDRRPTGGSCQGFERGRANTKCHTQT